MKSLQTTREVLQREGHGVTVCLSNLGIAFPSPPKKRYHPVSQSMSVPEVVTYLHSAVKVKSFSDMDGTVLLYSKDQGGVLLSTGNVQPISYQG